MLGKLLDDQRSTFQVFGKGLEELTPGFCGASLITLDVLLGITYEAQDDVGSVKPWGIPEVLSRLV